MQTAFLETNVHNSRLCLNVNSIPFHSQSVTTWSSRRPNTTMPVASVAGSSCWWCSRSRICFHFLFNHRLVFRRFIRHRWLCRTRTNEVRQDVTESTPEPFWNGYCRAVIWTNLQEQHHQWLTQKYKYGKLKWIAEIEFHWIATLK